MIVGVQFLRFYAALCVILTHTLAEQNYAIKVGNFGVDLFFVISGFIIVYVTETQTRAFLLRRLIRIVPLYWLFTALLVVIGFAMPHFLNGFRADPLYIASSFLFIPHYVEGQGYSPVLNLGWTLNFEMFFYILFFVAMKISHRYRAVICAAMLLACVAAVQAYWWVFQEEHFFIFYKKEIMLCFVWGMTCYYILCWNGLGRLFAKLPLVALALPLLALPVLQYFAFKHDFNSTVPRFVLYGVPSLILMTWVLHSEARLKPVGAVLNRLGDYSYSMYLIHLYVIALLARVVGVETGGFEEFLVYFTFIVAAVLVASHVCLVLIERPSKAWLTRRLIAGGETRTPRPAPPAVGPLRGLEPPGAGRRLAFGRQK